MLTFSVVIQSIICILCVFSGTKILSGNPEENVDQMLKLKDSSDLQTINRFGSH